MSFLKNSKIKLQSCRGHEFLKLLYALFLFKVIYIIVGSIFNYIWYAIITIVVEVVGPTQKFHEKFREINFTKKFHEIDNKRHTASISSVHDHWLVQQTLVCTKHWDQIVNFFFLTNTGWWWWFFLSKIIQKLLAGQYKSLVDSCIDVSKP